MPIPRYLISSIIWGDENWCFWKEMVASFRSWEHQRNHPIQPVNYYSKDQCGSLTCLLLIWQLQQLRVRLQTSFSNFYINYVHFHQAVIAEMRKQVKWGVKTGSQRVLIGKSDGVPKVQMENNNVREVVEKSRNGSFIQKMVIYLFIKQQRQLAWSLDWSLDWGLYGSPRSLERCRKAPDRGGGQSAFGSVKLSCSAFSPTGFQYSSSIVLNVTSDWPPSSFVPLCPPLLSYLAAQN